jgi:hypothetical protein
MFVIQSNNVGIERVINLGPRFFWGQCKTPQKTENIRRQRL